MTVRLDHSVFIHVPRTAGLWLGEAAKGFRKQILTGDLDSHLPSDGLPLEWSGLTSFSIIRHPWAWVRSRWSHSMEHRLKEDGRTFGIHGMFECYRQDTFEETLKRILRNYPGLATDTFWQMQSRCEHLIRTEDLPGAAVELIRKLEGEQLADVPRFNDTSARWADKMNVPDSLKEDFIAAEINLVQAWEACSWHGIRA